MNNSHQDFKRILKMSVKALFTALIALNLVACGEDGGSNHSNSSNNSYNMSQEACYNQKYDVGIPGNIYCPYKGQTINGQVEYFAQIEWHGAIYLDFGLRYNDQCPTGEVPVYEYINGYLRLKSCDYIGDDFFDPTFISGHHNSSSCAGGYAGDRNCIPGF
jgi:hypothetical protein